MKLKREAIDVQCTADVPQSFTRRGRHHSIERVLDHWMYRSKWWAQEEERHYWSLQCRELSIEIFQREGRWYSARIWD